jgi:hypothetical protein
VRREEIESLDDVQRMLWVLAPELGARRILVVGRKRLTRRFWAFVAADDALGGRARTLGAGTYRIESHDGHTHLELALEGDCTLCADIGLPVRGNYIVSVMNPDPTLWSNAQAELFETATPTPFPPALQERFGEHRYLPLAPEFLVHPGAELVFVTVVS